jgi:DNA-binding NtrC family response regulator
MGYTTTRSQKVLCAAHFSCPVQVLVVDHHNGSAEILVDTVSRLIDTDISVTTFEDPGDAMRHLEMQHYDVVIIGLDNNGAEPLSVMPYIRVQHPDLPVLAIGRRVRKSDLACAEHFDVQDIFLLPQRASKMKDLVKYLSKTYFTQTMTV